MKRPTRSPLVLLPAVFPIALLLVVAEGVFVRTTVAGIPVVFPLLALLVLLAVLANVYLLSRPTTAGGWRDLPRATRYLMLGGSVRFPFLVAVKTDSPVAGRRTSSRAGTRPAKPKAKR